MNETSPRRTWGMRFTERYLLRFFGPPELGGNRAPRETGAHETPRDARIDAELTRVIGPDGRAYLVRRDDPSDRDGQAG